MISVSINKMNGVIQFGELVSMKSIHLDKLMYIYMWEAEPRELHIAIKNKDTEELESTEKISLALGLVIFLEKLEGYGFEVSVVEGISFSLETTQKSQGLVQAGFSKLIKKDDNYTVDDIFQQNFLLESELQCLLENNVIEINLSEIK